MSGVLKRITLESKITSLILAYIKKKLMIKRSGTSVTPIEWRDIASQRL